MALLIGSPGTPWVTISVSLIALSTLPDTNLFPIRQGALMHQLLDRFRRWHANVILADTTFCESCSQVCTSSCRYEAQVERVRSATQRAGLLRL